MAGEKVTRILRAKSSFSDEEIAVMSDAIGWDWIYADAKPRKEKLTQVCFTGCSVKEKEELSQLANNANLEVVRSVTKKLAFLCCGENAGSAKPQSARDNMIGFGFSQAFSGSDSSKNALAGIPITCFHLPSWRLCR
jgi:hypothetical protein